MMRRDIVDGIVFGALLAVGGAVIIALTKMCEVST